MIACDVDDNLFDTLQVLFFKGIQEGNAVHLDGPAEAACPGSPRRRGTNFCLLALDSLLLLMLKRFFEPGSQFASKLIQQRHGCETVVLVDEAERIQFQTRGPKLVEGGAGSAGH